MMVRFLYSKIIAGGAETLILRLGRHLMKYEEVQIFCMDISKNMEYQYNQNNIKIKKIDEWNPKRILLNGEPKDVVFTFSLRDFLMCESYVKEKNMKCQVLLYILHPKILRLERLNALKYLKKVTKKYIEKMIFQYIENGNIIFMDEMCIEWTEQFYNRKIKNMKDILFRLPIEDIEWDEEQFQKKIKKTTEDYQILTIARADFPFKAYIKGLIEDFTTLQKKYDSISLKIISYGADIDELKKWIKIAEFAGAKNIELVGETEYDMLEKYYKGTNLYVGMGTTLLDAAKYGVLSMNTLMNTYTLKSTGFFHDYPNLLGAEKDNCRKGLEIMEEAISMSNVEYEKYSRKTRELFKQYYSIEHFINRLLKYSLKTNKCFIPMIYREAIKYLQKIESNKNKREKRSKIYAKRK